MSNFTELHIHALYISLFHFIFQCHLILLSIYLSDISLSNCRSNSIYGYSSVYLSQQHVNTYKLYCFLYQLTSCLIIGITLTVILSIRLFHMSCKRNSSFRNELIPIKLHSCNIQHKDVHKGGLKLSEMFKGR